MREPKSVVLVADSLNGGLGVAARSDWAVAETLFARAVLLGPRSDYLNTAAWPGVVEAPIPTGVRPIRRWLAARRQIRRYVREQLPQPVLLHAHGLRAMSLTWPWRNMIVTYHGARPLNRTWLIQRAFDLVLRAVPRLVDSAFSAAPLPGGWQSIWLDPLHPPSEEPLRDGKSQRLELLWVGRISPQKDFAKFVSLVERLRNLGLRLAATAAGAVDEGYEPELIARAERAQVRLLGDVADVASLYSRSTIMCLFSHFEAKPFAIEEALMRGVPVVASDLPGNRVLISDARHLTDDVDHAAALISELHIRDEIRARGQELREEYRKRRASAESASEVMRATYESYKFRG